MPLVWKLSSCPLREENGEESAAASAVDRGNSLQASKGCRLDGTARGRSEQQMLPAGPVVSSRLLIRRQSWGCLSVSVLTIEGMALTFHDARLRIPSQQKSGSSPSSADDHPGFHSRQGIPRLGWNNREGGGRDGGRDSYSFGESAEEWNASRNLAEGRLPSNNAAKVPEALANVRLDAQPGTARLRSR